MSKQIPPLVKEVLQHAAREYSDSNATTNAGRVLRFIARFITSDIIVQLFAHKFKQ
jgi:hypothetical protein